MQTLIVFYSLSGHTQKLAKAIAKASGADLEQIQDVKSRHSLFGYLRSIYQTLLDRQPKIRHLKRDPSKYDLVILGVPVWIKRLPSPMRTYLEKQKAKFPNVAFFCTEGSSGGQSVFKTMETLCKKHPVATLEVTEAELKSGSEVDKIRKFTEEITRIKELKHV